MSAPSRGTGMSEQVGVGDVLAGKYRVERVLGAGGMGVVLAARHVQLDVQVAVKLMSDEALDDPELVARFLREARAAARLRGEHVARVIDVGTLESGAPYLVMEYLEGSDLHAVLASRGALPIQAAADYVAQACEAVDEAHGVGIVHRDLKPSNLFLTRRPNGSACIKVLDFGISKADRVGASSPDRRTTGAQRLIGSPSYMAPEQMRRPREVDGRADIWALGATLYELLTGQVPFPGESLLEIALQVAENEPRRPRELRPDIPAGLEEVVLTCLAKDRERRFPTPRSLMMALGPFAGGAPRARVASSLTPALAPSVVTPARAAQPARVEGAWKTALLLGGLLGALSVAAVYMARSPLVAKLRR